MTSTVTSLGNEGDRKGLHPYYDYGCGPGSFIVGVGTLAVALGLITEPPHIFFIESQ